MFDTIERENAISEAVTISEFVRPHLKEAASTKAPALIKALANYIERTSINNPAELLQEINQQVTRGNMQEALQRMLIHMVTVGVASEPLIVRMYSTGDTARMFGVSVATINNWINQGRIRGVEKGARFKQARIPENAIYISPSGGSTQIAEAAEQYEQEQARLSRHIPTTPAEELAEIVNAVVHYEKKYGGQYEHTLANKAELTLEEQRDAHEWRGLIREIEEKRE